MVYNENGISLHAYAPHPLSELSEKSEKSVLVGEKNQGACAYTKGSNAWRGRLRLMQYFSFVCMPRGSPFSQSHTCAYVPKGRKLSAFGEKHNATFGLLFLTGEQQERDACA